MSHTLSKSPTKMRPKAAIRPQASSFPPSVKEKVQISHSFGLAFSDKMTLKSNPVAIGTRGTVGSLIMQEIEYFSRLEMGCQSSSNKPARQLANSASTGGFSKSKLESLITVPARKKRGSNRLIPSMCSMVEVAESNQRNMFSGCTYRNLKADLKR
ncbi:UNVERIFIED_CONTAM: hypothetical protein Sradi_2268200 [Sesamum radiatum]|uniref:Uncharacterized protein n=1 Tax=Sesamum radiatum TaxID=300843 RepID=A0AAW2T3E0_SESRA